MGLQQLNFAGLNKIEVSIMRLREFEPPEGYYLAFSGGKDSEVVYDLAVKSGVKFDAHFNVTTVDPPEVLKFIRENYPNVEWHYPDKNMYQLVIEKGYPQRQSRFCCEELKEHGGEGRFVLTGIRAAESNKRAQRLMVELCTKGLGKKFLHPIIDWSAWERKGKKGGEVWEYIQTSRLPYCKLYDEGFKRIGCVLCPMSSAKQAQKDLTRFPKIARAWRIAFEHLWNKHTEGTEKFPSPEVMWKRWLSRKGQGKDTGQCSMFV